MQKKTEWEIKKRPDTKKTLKNIVVLAGSFLRKT